MQFSSAKRDFSMAVVLEFLGYKTHIRHGMSWVIQTWAARHAYLVLSFSWIARVTVIQQLMVNYWTWMIKILGSRKWFATGSCSEKDVAGLSWSMSFHNHLEVMVLRYWFELLRSTLNPSKVSTQTWGTPWTLSNAPELPRLVSFISCAGHNSRISIASLSSRRLQCT